MTEMPASAATMTARRGKAISARTAKRYAAERRFRFYGAVAIGLTAAFVLVLLIDILVKGIPAFTEHRLVLDVPVSQEAVDPEKSGDPQKIRSADFETPIRDALRSLMPSVSARSDRKLLFGLLSSGAADDLRNTVMSNPALVGTTVRTVALLSDDADQFMKSRRSDISYSVGKSALTITQEGNLFRLAASGGDFIPALRQIETFVEKSIRRAQPEIDRLQQLILDKETQLKAAEQRLQELAGQDGADRASAVAVRDTLAADLEGLSSALAVLKVKQDSLQARLEKSVANQSLDSSLPSLLVVADVGTLKILEVSPNGALAEAIIPIPGTTAPAGAWRIASLAVPETNRRISDKEAAWLEALEGKGAVESGFAWRFLTSGDSREPELAGIRGALVGSAFTLLVTLIICLPLGVGAAIYLEEFAPKNRLTDIIEININNLAAVPSIVFGLLGLAMFLNFFGLPRSAPLVGGLVLALLVLPTIIIASRAALRSVPPSIKEAALGVGASHQQAIFHHVLPLAMPGIMTGTIIGMAHALGETAPLLMIGMVAFIVDIPHSLTGAATVMPVQIYLWSDLPEIAFQAKTAAAIIVLLIFLFAMNATALFLRKRFERRW
jgi:phosphate transport system permease protein